MKLIVPARIITTDEYKAKLRDMAAEFYDDLPTEEVFRQRIQDAEIITNNYYIPLTKELIDVAPKLKYIIVPAVGYQSVDTEYAASKGIAVLNCPTHNSQAVAEHALTLLLASDRHIVAAHTEIREGTWDDHKYAGHELAGKILGLVGYGNIGTRLETLARGLGIQVRYVNSKSSDDELDQLLATSDFVCVCIPLNERTQHLINAQRLQLLKPDAILINVARGAVIDQNALITLLETSTIRAALDVFEGEPDSDIARPSDAIMKLAQLPNVIVTPHIAYNTPESREKLGREILANIESCLRGSPQNRVN